MAFKIALKSPGRSFGNVGFRFLALAQKTALAASILIFASGAFASDLFSCSEEVQYFNPHPSVANLNENWAQQETGSDLSKAELKLMLRDTNMEDTSAAVGVTDAGFVSWLLEQHQVHLTQNGDSFLSKVGSLWGNAFSNDAHGSYIIESIFNKTFGSSTLGTLKQVTEPKSYHDEEISKEEALALGIRVISRSTSFTESFRAKYEEIIAELYHKGIVYVVASGNQRFNIDCPNWTGDTNHVIQVGSYNYDGQIDIYSCQGPKVFIFAPGSEGLQKVSDNTTFHLFGRTSAATPHVSGAVADILSLVPNATVQDVRFILEKTAFHLKSGILFLNNYRAINVALKLRALNAHGNDFHKTVNLQKSEVYEFVEQANELERKANLLKPELTCANASAVLSQFRAAFFLNPHPALAQKIATQYATLGLATNGLFYDTLSKNLE
jgi:hypothetical protein